MELTIHIAKTIAHQVAQFEPGMRAADPDTATYVSIAAFVLVTTWIIKSFRATV